MKHAALLLLGLLAAPAAAFQPPQGPIAASGSVELAFTPGGPADRMVIAAIDAAQRQVLVQAFSFTHKKIAQALIRAKRRGLDVQLIADAQQAEVIRTSVVRDIAAGGVPVFLDAEHESAHNKVMVIDAGTPGAAVVTGSFNFTHAAQYRNAENLLILRGNPQLAEAYLRQWQAHRAHARPLP